MSLEVATQRRLWTLLISENAFYGGFFVLYFISSLLLLQRRRHIRKQANNGFGNGPGGLDNEDQERLQTMRFWEITGGIMFVILTVHWALNWVIYLGEPPEAVARMIVFGRVLMSEIVLITGDLIIIHRLWIIGNKNKLLVAFPLFSLVTFFVFAIPLSWEYYLVYSRKHLPWILRQPLWLMGVVSSTLSVNVYCTLFMSFKIWRANRGAQRYGGGQLLHVIAILVESAALYSLWMIAVLVLLIAGDPLYIIFYDIATQLYGFSTMLISCRVGLGWATGESSQAESERVSTWRPAIIPVTLGDVHKSEEQVA